jgi:hypothetical protein
MINSIRGVIMRIHLPIVASLGVFAALMGSSVGAQVPQLPEELACAKSRAEVKADCIQFMKTHRWDDGASNWVLKSGAKSDVRPPEGVVTREQVRADRNAFLATHTWNDGKTMWVAIPGKARDVASEPLECAQTRAEVQKDCAAFLKTHRFDEGKGAYVPIKK